MTKIVAMTRLSQNTLILTRFSDFVKLDNRHKTKLDHSIVKVMYHRDKATVY